MLLTAETLQALEMIKEWWGIIPACTLITLSITTIFIGRKTLFLPLNALYAFAKRVFNLPGLNHWGKRKTVRTSGAIVPSKTLSISKPGVFRPEYD